MTLNRTVMLIAALILLIANITHADYCAIGQIEGQVCRGFVIESCKNIQVDAVKGSDGQLYTVKECFQEVSEYRESTDRCWIRTKSKGAGLFSWGVNAIGQPVFLHKDENGSYKELDVEYITFKCVKR